MNERVRIMPPNASPSTFTPAPFGVMLQLKFSLMRNRINQILDESPIRALAGAGFVLVIWLSLFVLFREVFSFLQRNFNYQTPVAVPYVFYVFFVAMAVLLTFSSAVLCYGALFSREEPAFLLAGPTPPSHIVGIFFLESLFYSSWAMVLFGLPLMVAIGTVEELPWYFFVIFAGTFLAFVPIPGALGLIAAWAVARWIPRSSRRVLVTAGAVVLGVTLLWIARTWTNMEGATDGAWLMEFLTQLTVLRSAFLPSTWASQAIRYAMQRQPNDAAFYLYVTLAHALFLGWLAIGIVSRQLRPAYARAKSRGGARPGRMARDISGAISSSLFGYLQPPLRALVRKDLQTFLRDPMQWSQLAIMLGLLTLYLLYLPQFRNVHELGRTQQILYAFLNYSAVTLIISTFTSRFVFPMVSMEGRQMWLVGLWPLSRRSVLWAKFQFALGVTLFAALLVMLLSVYSIGLPFRLGLVLVASNLAACFGLCGMAIGLGARLPNFNERSAARVAAGLGGTVNLITSLFLVIVTVALTGLLCLYLHKHYGHAPAQPRVWPVWDGVVVCITLLQIALGLGAGWMTMKLGVRHFNTAEF